MERSMKPTKKAAKTATPGRSKVVRNGDFAASPSDELGHEVCLVVVGYAARSAPFVLLGRVSADTGYASMPNPPLRPDEMESVAFAAKMALAKVLAKRAKICGTNYAEGAWCARNKNHKGVCSQFTVT